MGGLDKRAFIVDVADAELRTALVGEVGDELGLITCVSFSRSSRMLAVTTNLGRVYFVPTRPFGTRGTVDALRAKTRLVNLSASFAKSLNWLNAVSPWIDRESKPVEHVRIGRDRRGSAPSQQGSTALHLLADVNAGGGFWGGTVSKSQQLNEAVITAWARADVPYFPVCNANGATPLEVAVAAKNHLFMSYLLDSEKGAKGVMWNTDPMWKHAASFRPDLVTVRDLSKLLEWPSALQYAVQVCSRLQASISVWSRYFFSPFPCFVPEHLIWTLLHPSNNTKWWLCSRLNSTQLSPSLRPHDQRLPSPPQYIAQPKLLSPAPSCVTEGLETHSFMSNPGTFEIFEVTGAPFGAACRRGLWADFDQSRRWDPCAIPWHAQQLARTVCTCRRRRLQSPTEAFYVSIEGIAGAGRGHNVLWQLVFGGAATLAAFSGPAMRYVVAHRWKEIGYLFYVVRLTLYLLFVVLQTWLSIEVSYRENESDYASADPDGFWRRRVLAIALLVFCVGWALDELIQISVAGRFTRNCSLFRGDEKQGRYSGNFPAKEGHEVSRVLVRCPLLRMQPCVQKRSSLHSDGTCQAPTLCIAMRNDVAVAINGVGLWLGVLNTIDTVSIICTSSAAVLDLVLVASSDESLHGVAQGLMAAAGLFAWMRFFEQVRGSRSIGFYSRLIQTSTIGAFVRSLAGARRRATHSTTVTRANCGGRLALLTHTRALRALSSSPSRSLRFSRARQISCRSLFFSASSSSHLPLRSPPSRRPARGPRTR